MQQDNASFWADIKANEELLATNPDSFCFARLAEIYLKLGLVDDALHTAREGICRHRGYVAGQRALALACYAKGLTDECRAALELVTTAVPEDIDSLRKLSRLYVEAGNSGAAVKALKTALEFNADDIECRLELEALERSRVAEVAEVVEVADRGVEKAVPFQDLLDRGFVPFDDDQEPDEEIIEDVEILEIEEADLIEEEPSVLARTETGLSPAATQQEPFFTSTLAEVYVQQGFVSKALDIYRIILADDPSNAAIQTRIAELESSGTVYEVSQMEEPVLAAADAFQELSKEPVMHDTVPSTATDAVIGMPPVQKEAGDPVVATLEGWLDNVRRMKECP
jgi:predicted Zn-dependent protease